MFVFRHFAFSLLSFLFPFLAFDLLADSINWKWRPVMSSTTFLAPRVSCISRVLFCWFVFSLVLVAHTKKKKRNRITATSLVCFSFSSLGVPISAKKTAVSSARKDSVDLSFVRVNESCKEFLHSRGGQTFWHRGPFSEIWTKARATLHNSIYFMIL